ncbi:hypothetical protein HDV62DRAFT_372886 [Trichoderma sp. SZMC 28011]
MHCNVKMARLFNLSALLSVIVALAPSSEGVATANKQVEVPRELTYNLPQTFHSDLAQGFLGGTVTTSKKTQRLLKEAYNANFVIYDAEFKDILGKNPTLELVAQDDEVVAYEGGLWVADRDEVWMTSSVVVYNRTWISILKLKDNTIHTPSFHGDDFVTPNGGYYFNGTAYFGTVGNVTSPAGVVGINPRTKEVTTVVNSYFGLNFNFIDDVAWTRRCGKNYMFFTDYGTPAVFPGVANKGKLQIANAVWRFDPQDATLMPVILRSEVAAPNGVRVNADGTKLFVGDYSLTSVIGAANETFGSPSVIEYDLDEDARPVNKRPFFMARDAAVDGIHLDDFGRVWTAEDDAISVRDKKGKLLGSINTWNLRENSTVPVVANFALAGDRLVVLASTRIWVVKLGQQLVSGGDLS